MISLERYKKLKGQADRCRRELDRIEGALSAELNRLKTDFGCDTLEDAVRLLKKKRAKADRMADELTKAVERFKRKWEHLE